MSTVSPAKTLHTIPATPESARRKKKQRDRDYVVNPTSSTKKKKPIKPKSPPVEVQEDTSLSTRNRALCTFVA